MAVPFRRVSKSRRKMRNSHVSRSLSIKSIFVCPQCGDKPRYFFLCRFFHYRGKQINKTHSLWSKKKTK